MSVRKRRLILAPDARRDYRSLMAFTEQQWGKAQRRAFRQRFTEAFAELVRFPELGAARPEFGPGIRALPIGQHVVIYEPSETALRVVRILHSRRDFNTELS